MEAKAESEAVKGSCHGSVPMTTIKGCTSSVECHGISSPHVSLGRCSFISKTIVLLWAFA